MIGIYKLTNKINNRIYIGQSVNVESRIKQHFRNANNSNTHTYDYPLYRAIRKYGKENFIYELIEETSLENITEREQYWIDYYNSIEKGYNQVPAEDAKRYDNCNFAILTMKEVEEITELLKCNSLHMSEIAEKYNMSGSAIEDINKGRRWPRDIDYPIRKNAKSVSHQGEKQNTAILTSEDVIEIRKRYEFETLTAIFEDYKERISLTQFKRVCYGTAWKHLPFYRKKEKRWVYPD